MPIKTPELLISIIWGGYDCLRSGDAFVLPKVEASKHEIKIKGALWLKGQNDRVGR